MKTCIECNKEKDLLEFYSHKQMADGHLNKCKICVQNRIHKYRLNNLDAVKEYDKKRNALPHRVKARKEYIKTENGKKARTKAKINYRKHYPMKYAAHVIVTKAIKTGTLIKQNNCSECNSTYKIEGHHDDYTKPLDVRWLCELCHKTWHRHNKPIYE
jgi:hypothetical protein